MLGLTAVEFGLRLIYLVALTRFLGADGFGAWSYALAAYGLALGVIALGFETLLPARIGGEVDSGGRIVRTAALLRLGMSVVAACGLGVAAMLLEEAGPLRWAILLTIPVLLGRATALLVRSIFVAYEAVGQQVRVSVVIRLTEVAAGFLVLSAGGSVLLVLALHGASWIVEALVSARLLKRLPIRGASRFDAGVAVDLMRKGVLLGIAGAAVTWLLTGPVIQLRHSSDDLGITGQIALALQGAALLLAGGQALFSAALPVLSRRMSAGDPRAAHYAPAVAVVTVALAIPGAVLGHLFGPALVSWLIGPEFDLAGGLIGQAVLIGAAMIAPVGYLQTSVVRGRVALPLLASVAGGMTMTAAFAPLLSYFGPVGAVYAAGLGWTVRAVLVVVLVGRDLRREQ